MKIKISIAFIALFILSIFVFQSCESEDTTHENISSTIRSADCNETAFGNADCFRSAKGDGDGIHGTLGLGGPCNSPNYLTSAQEEVQKKFNDRIPKFIRNNKGVRFDIKYRNVECTWNDISYGDFRSFLSPHCSNLGLFYSDNTSNLSEIEYTAEELNCTLCALNEFVAANTPAGKKVQKVNLWSDFLTGGSGTRLRWQLEICYGETYLVSTEDQPAPPNPIIPSGM